MPMKWSPENDQQLLLKILETSSVTCDSKAIAAAWPLTSDNTERPTPRAISERLIKIRSLAKSNGAAHFSVSSAQAKKTGSATSNSNGLRTPTSTPTKRGRAAGGKKNDGGGVGKKRKGMDVDVDEEKQNDNDDDDDDDDGEEKGNFLESPSKKVKVKEEIKGVQLGDEVEEEDDEDDDNDDDEEEEDGEESEGADKAKRDIFLPMLGSGHGGDGASYGEMTV